MSLSIARFVWKTVKRALSGKDWVGDRIYLIEKSEIVEKEQEMPQILNFSNIVRRLQIKKKLRLWAFIDNIEEQTFKAELQFKGHSSIILFKRNEKLKIFLFSLKWIQGKLKKINIKTLN